jgi:hypothetical protein
LVEVAASAMEEWVFEPSVPFARLDLGRCPDLLEGGEWLTLYRYASRKTSYATSGMAGAPFRQNDFHFVMMVGIEHDGVSDFVRDTRSSWTDFHHDWVNWGDLTDGPYLYEAGRRSTWPDTEWIETDGIQSAKVRYLRFCREYHWERHLDGTLPSGFSMQLPNPWLQRALGLRADADAPGIFLDADDRPTIVSSRGGPNTYCLVRRDAIEPILAGRGVTPLWVGIGERVAWPDPAENSGPQRRWNGVAWREGETWRHDVWVEDHRPGQGPRQVRSRLTP